MTHNFSSIATSVYSKPTYTTSWWKLSSFPSDGTTLPSWSNFRMCHGWDSSYSSACTSPSTFRKIWNTLGIPQLDREPFSLCLVQLHSPVTDFRCFLPWVGFRLHWSLVTRPALSRFRKVELESVVKQGIIMPVWDEPQNGATLWYWWLRTIVYE